MMHIDILTLFPGIFTGPLQESILKIAQEKKLLSITLVDIREFCSDKHKTADDEPYGGGPGMVIKPEPLTAAIESRLAKYPDAELIFLSPQGKLFNQQLARELANKPNLVLVCGRYEGIDERVKQLFNHQEISIGDYVLTGGEIPALVIIDAVSRLLPGVVGNPESVIADSFSEWAGFDYPHYTRPAVFRGLAVPEVLTSGNHERIRRWRRKQALKKTRLVRPELIKADLMTAEDKQLIAEIEAELNVK
ncbi:MAG: tRNA (guanosine(37)-N1)-methyltransferase TrmD [bacterium]|nr:tRNA (guanosine(37)-N1)-methyltransferase TrmD [bacterium]